MFDGISRVHFVGIGGIGVSALAKFFALQGAVVSGSDLAPSSITQELVQKGITVHFGHAVGNVPDTLDLLVYSPAVPAENVERATTRQRGVRELSYPQALGELSRGYSTIAVCGTNGKSTTTAMLGKMLVDAGYDPTVIVGTKVPDFPDGNLRMGKGRFLVVEACEYREHFLHLWPEMIVVTNIEEDHLDYFRDIAHVRAAFQSFVDKLKGKGMVMWNADDPESRSLTIEHGISFGTHEANYVATNRRVEPELQRFQIARSDGAQEECILRIPGTFNMMNALAAAAAASELGISFETIRHTLETFGGLWRRFELLGTWNGADVYSDYGHHPTAIAGTLQAAREFFPEKRIVLCFQPHQHARTKTLFNEFVAALSQADVLVVPEIYEVAGRTESDDISSNDLVEAIKKLHPGKQVRYAKNLDDADRVLRDIVQPCDVLIFQGAGDIDELARNISTRL